MQSRAASGALERRRSGTNRAIGFVVIGGQSLVLVLTLVVTPVAYSLFDDASQLRVWARVRRLLPVRRAEPAPLSS